MTQQTVYLKDYTAPAFNVEHINLDIHLFDDKTIVKSTLNLTRQHEGELVLFGRDLELVQITLNQQILNQQDYTLDNEHLVIHHAPDSVVVTTEVIIHPEQNTQLEGLYLAGNNLFVTQNEPEGFRKITFFPDRPDVLSVFTTRIEADQKYPTLLANGNLIEKGTLENGRHYVVWQDPTKKPSYLFACVIGDLAVLRDQFVTAENRHVNLEIYAEQKDIEKCHIAMQALKHAMRWDEEHYGRCYDLDNYMIVATSHFNMGAMENKGLNIFNTSCVLADEKYTTDKAIMRVQSVIAHEYFHNWTGNRITCRDWFQLCLKEGLTVFRDQSFSEDLQSSAVQRIDDVDILKAHQFPEDTGPLAHPPRPDHFVEINNFYTATVYEKGAEISRMMSTLLGKEKFRQGTDRYFELFDGQAVTVEDWIDALSQGSKVDLKDFLHWYNQPHTPHLEIQQSYDENQQLFKLTMQQNLKAHHYYGQLKAVPIPIALALFDSQTGEQLTLNCQDLITNHVKDGIYLLKNNTAEITFEHVEKHPIVSLLRHFSAPVHLTFDYSDADLAFLIQYEKNGFNQWQAAQTLLERILLSDIKIDLKNQSIQVYLSAMKMIIEPLSLKDPLLASRLFDIPTESYLASKIDIDYQPEYVRERRDLLVSLVAESFKDFWKKYYQTHTIGSTFSEAMGIRALRNICLNMLAQQHDPSAFELAYQQYQHTQNMTERLGAMRTLVWFDSALSQQVLEDFYQQFKHEDLCIDQWFMLQACHPNLTSEQLMTLVKHADYDLNVPNRVRSITSGLNSRPVHLWSESGVQYLITLTEKMDQKNPILGSRLIQSLSRWYTLVEPCRSQVYAKLTQLRQKIRSKNISETIDNLLNIEK